MFQLDESDFYWYPVTVPMRDAEGRERNFQFDAKFRRLDKDELKKALNAEAPPNDDEVIADVLLGWRKVQDKEGADLEHTPENREKLLKRHPVQPSIVKAWLVSIGIKGAQKN